MPFRPNRLLLALAASLAALALRLGGAEAASAASHPLLDSYREEIEPLLDYYCYDCHGWGMSKGGVVLDEFASDSDFHDPELWMRVTRNLRTHIMPPKDEDSPTDEERQTIAQWIKTQALGLDPRQPDPGRVVVRRLNRVEYRNTIRDLMGVDFDAEAEFPPDDSGHGFDNLGEVLSISPMLMEKYLDAAQTIVGLAVPTEPWVAAEVSYDPTALAAANPGRGRWDGEDLELSFYERASLSLSHQVEAPGSYRVTLALRSAEKYVDTEFDYNRCRLTLRIDGETVLQREFVREGWKSFEFPFEQQWEAGAREIELSVEPLTPGEEQVRDLRLRVESISIQGPFEPDQLVRPPRYSEFFPDPVPDTPESRRAYAEKNLARFASRAFRRPVDPPTARRLAELALHVSAQPGKTFEAGMAQAMVAILASPRFLFREEGIEGPAGHSPYAYIDEYALASRLSYFLWSSMPDEELMSLAKANQLRANLDQQVRRMMDDPKSSEFISNFSGQWLQARDIEAVNIDSFQVHLREHPVPGLEKAYQTFRSLRGVPREQLTEEQNQALDEARAIYREARRMPRPEFKYTLRRAMRQETERYFDHVIRQDRPLVELIDSDYAFLNEELAEHYGIEGVSGEQVRKVQLPPGSPRGGVLTQGTILAVTSNPNRTSPVKRGVFLLENILGTPPPPPPPNIPALEDAASEEELAKLSLRENLALHREDKTCYSCHSRMDPLGLAMENFNAMGRWRDFEHHQPIEPQGELITGETFQTFSELKRILATSRRNDFYHCIAEKMLTYAIGRGVEASDLTTLDQLVAALQENDGRPSALISAIIHSAPFQQTRSPDHEYNTFQPPTAIDHERKQDLARR